MSQDIQLSRSSVEAAYTTIKPFVHRTPLITSSSLSASLPGGNALYFKAENFQKAGAFKFRGASHSLERLTFEQLAKGVCTHSSGELLFHVLPPEGFVYSASGNHAGALALAAKERNTKCYVVMPSNSSQPKIDAVRAYGAEITFCEPTAAARQATLEAVQARTGAAFIPPYDAVNTILGQGTAFLEVLEQAPEPLAAVITPVGGGGLLAGTALAAEGTGIRVFGAEPTGASDCAQGLREGRRIEDFVPNTICDGLRTPVGRLNYPILKEKVEHVIVVTDDEVVEAMRLMWERLKLVVEPSSAAAFAAVRSKAFQSLGIEGPIAIVISGGNVDLSKPLPWTQQ